MKKIILSLALAVVAISFANAQDNAIGIKAGYGVDLSFQKGLGSNRLELNLGLNSLDNKVVALNGLYQWMFDLSQLADGFNWYAGAGATVGFGNDNFWLGAAGNIGIEYNFDFPLQLALDWTPTLWIVPDVDFGYDGIKLGIRYKF